MELSVVVVLPVTAGPAQALACLEALAALGESRPWEAVVVAPADAGAAGLLDALEGDVTVVREAPADFAAGALAGARRARAGAIALLRDLPAPAPGWLDAVLDALDGARAVATAPPDRPAAHPAETQALVLRADDVDTLDAIQGVPDELALPALAMELARRGPVVTAAAATVGAAPATTTGLAPGAPLELSAVIPTLDATSPRARLAVAALRAHTPVPHEVIVLDNGAPPQGFTGPVNAALRAASGRYVAVLNDDVEVLPGWWPPLREALDAGEAIVFPRTVDTATREDFSAWCFAMTAGAVERLSHAPGELFDPRFVIWFQDTDLLVRAKAAGTPPRLVTRSRIRHGLSRTLETREEALSAWIRKTVADDQAMFRAKWPQLGLRSASLGRR
jgi:hypothetical protein